MIAGRRPEDRPVQLVLLLLFAAAEGALTASFVSLALARLPGLLAQARASGKSGTVLLGLCWPPSHCDSCNARVRLRDLIPVLSYVLLRGHCRDCGTAFGSREIKMELAGAAAGVAGVLLFGLTPGALLCFLLLLAAAAFAITRSGG